MKKLITIAIVITTVFTANAQGYYNMYTMQYSAREHKNTENKFNLFEWNANHDVQFWPGNLSAGIGIGMSKVKMWNPDKDHTGDAVNEVCRIKLGPLNVAWGIDWTVIGDVLGFALYKHYDYSRYGLTLGEITWCNNNFWTSQSFSIGVVYEHYMWYMADSSGNHIGWTPALESEAYSYAGEKSAYGIQLCYRFNILSFNAEFTTASRSYHIMLVYPLEYFIHNF